MYRNQQQDRFKEHVIYYKLNHSSFLAFEIIYLHFDLTGSPYIWDVK